MGTKDIYYRSQEIEGEKAKQAYLREQYIAAIGPVKPGYFKMVPWEKESRCPAGFFCPENTTQPPYCPSGFYCKDPSIKKKCPQGYFCPLGTTEPYKCNILSSCPAGSSNPQGTNFIIFVIIFCVIIVCAFFARNKYMARKRALFQADLKRLKSIDDAIDESVTDRLDAVDMPVNIRFDNLSKRLSNGVWVMQGVSGELKAGRTCAIMGPSGSGKTTFISILANRSSRTSGSVYVNGVNNELSHYSKLIGFVPQEDIMLQELTVQDILHHSASMRLPAKVSRSKIKNKVTRTIQMLGLTNIADNVIGSQSKRGISGGQRKRVNVGMELVAEPTVLFLDEPTSGLDSTTALEICTLLRDLAHCKQLTVAAVVHCPSPEAFRRFDDLMLLGAGGQIVYMGPREEASAYFSLIGFDIPPEENEVDFFINVVSNKCKSKYHPDWSTKELFDSWKRYIHKQPLSVPYCSYDIPAPPLLYGNDQHIICSTSIYFDNGNNMEKVSFWQNCKTMILSVFTRTSAWIYDVITEFKTWLLSFTRIFSSQHDMQRRTPNAFYNFFLCLRRALLQVFRTPQSFLLDQFLHLGCGIFISIAIQNLDYNGSQPKKVCDIALPSLVHACRSARDFLPQMGLIMGLAILFAGITVGSQTFGNDIVVYWRDSSAGMPTIPYFLAKMLVDIIRILIAAVMFLVSLTLFWSNYSNIRELYLIIVLLYFVAFAMGYFLSTIVSKESVGLAGTGFVLAWGIALSGVMPRLDKVNDPKSFLNAISFLWKLSPTNYAIEALYIREVINRPWEENHNTNQLSHGYFVSNKDINFLYIICIGLGWCVLALLGLKLMRRDMHR